MQPQKRFWEKGCQALKILHLALRISFSLPLVSNTLPGYLFRDFSTMHKVFAAAREQSRPGIVPQEYTLLDIRAREKALFFGSGPSR